MIAAMARLRGGNAGRNGRGAFRVTATLKAMTELRPSRTETVICTELRTRSQATRRCRAAIGHLLSTE